MTHWGGRGSGVLEPAFIDELASAEAELFVIDDGGCRAPDDWRPGRFPNGLFPVIAAVREPGMEFGLWVEVESVELRGELFPRHPEWTMACPGREAFRRYRADVGRTSVMLNFARPEAAGGLRGELPGDLDRRIPHPTEIR